MSPGIPLAAQARLSAVIPEGPLQFLLQLAIFTYFYYLECMDGLSHKLLCIED